MEYLYLIRTCNGEFIAKGKDEQDAEHVFRNTFPYEKLGTIKRIEEKAIHVQEFGWQSNFHLKS